MIEMSKVRVKICGIRTLAEARAALELGADAIGFNFWNSSPRFIEPSVAREIIAKLPPVISCVGVFVNERPEAVLEVRERARLGGVQLHGDESPEYCSALGEIRIIKALRVGDGLEPGLMDRFRVSAFLLDTHVKGSYGGTGKSFDWGIAVEAARRAPVILAGGLTVDNVAEAIRTVRPLGVDVCSGVESKPGRKDRDKMALFMREVSMVNSSGGPRIK
jgi:phosphoribosylanthranilate isomerase